MKQKAKKIALNLKQKFPRLIDIKSTEKSAEALLTYHFNGNAEVVEKELVSWLIEVVDKEIETRRW